jgi:hypothetical protein
MVHGDIQQIRTVNVKGVVALLTVNNRHRENRLGGQRTTSYWTELLTFKSP